MVKELSPFSWRVIDQIQKLIGERGLTDVQVLKSAGMPRNTFYAKMRGDSAMTTEDIDKLAQALSVEPELILRNASRGHLSVVPPLDPDLPGNVGGYLDDALHGLDTAAGTDETQADED
jgi:transcriptional regulator with XRE-family HTH domain